jgi:hypothetical protein
MKTFILDFKGFVNENFANEEIGTDLAAEVGTAMPEEVSKIAAGIVNGNFEGHKILGVEGNTIRVKLSDQDFQYAPDKLTLKDFGFETWSGKPYDVNLTLDDADPTSKEATYSIEFKPKEARRSKTETEEDDFVDQYENEPRDEFGDVPEEPESLADVDKTFRAEPDDEEDPLFEGRKKKQTGGFPNLKVKEVPRKAPVKQEKPVSKTDLFKKNVKKMAETDQKGKVTEKPIPPVKK